MTDGNEQAPAILDVPIGLAAGGMRRESDSLGEVLGHAARHIRERAVVTSPVGGGRLAHQLGEARAE